MIDLVAANRLLADRKFLSGPTDESLWLHLMMAIQGLTRAGEKLALPAFEEADAWKKAWALHAALKKRGPDAATEEAEQISRAAVSDGRLWSEFVADVEGLRRFQEKNRFQWDLLAEWAGLEPDDMADPMAGADPRFGRPPNWGKKARRIGGALRELQGLSPQRRSEIPGIVEERRLRRHLRETNDRLAALEQQNAELAQRLDAIETRLPSFKEVKDFVAA